MAKQSRPNTSTKQTSRLSTRRMGIAAAVLALCLLIIGTYSLQDQSPPLDELEAKPTPREEVKIPESNPPVVVEEIEEDKEVAPTPTPPEIIPELTAKPVKKRPAKKEAQKPAPSSVNWSSMALEIEANQPVLNWGTLSESNTAYFEIERSIDRETFTRIGKVAGGGPGDFLDQRYNFADPELAMIGFPRIYYRIKQVGLDKRVSTSQIYEHQFELNLGLYIKVDTIQDGIITLAYVADEACQALFQVLTKEGKVLYEERIDVGFNARRRKLDASIWGEGDYLMVLSNDQVRVSEWLQIRNEKEDDKEE